jgi:hypothetical protein
MAGRTGGATRSSQLTFRRRRAPALPPRICAALRSPSHHLVRPRARSRSGAEQHPTSSRTRQGHMPPCLPTPQTPIRGAGAKPRRRGSWGLGGQPPAAGAGRAAPPQSVKGAQPRHRTWGRRRRTWRARGPATEREGRSPATEGGGGAAERGGRSSTWRAAPHTVRESRAHATQDPRYPASRRAATLVEGSHEHRSE